MVVAQAFMENGISAFARVVELTDQLANTREIFLSHTMEHEKTLLGGTVWFQN